MATNAEEASLVGGEWGELIKTEQGPCVHDQWNHPYPPDRPWVHDNGLCNECGEPVEYERISPPEDHYFTLIAMPHTRTLLTFAVSGSDLFYLVRYNEEQ